MQLSKSERIQILKLLSKLLENKPAAELLLTKIESSKLVIKRPKGVKFKSTRVGNADLKIEKSDKDVLKELIEFRGTKRYPSC